MPVDCSLEEILIEDGLTGRLVKGICVTCGDCDNVAEGPGEADQPEAVHCLLIQLRKTCPQREQNRYRIMPD